MSNNQSAVSEQRFSESSVIEQELIPGVTNRITLHRKRKQGLIGFYRIGNKIFYGASHIAEFLERCERPARVKAAKGGTL